VKPGGHVNPLPMPATVQVMPAPRGRRHTVASSPSTGPCTMPGRPWQKSCPQQSMEERRQLCSPTKVQPPCLASHQRLPQRSPSAAAARNARHYFVMLGPYAGAGQRTFAQMGGSAEGGRCKAVPPQNRPQRRRGGPLCRVRMTRQGFCRVGWSACCPPCGSADVFTLHRKSDGHGRMGQGLFRDECRFRGGHFWTSAFGGVELAVHPVAVSRDYHLSHLCWKAVDGCDTNNGPLQAPFSRSQF
jgi:hypothetical protein